MSQPPTPTPSPGERPAPQDPFNTPLRAPTADPGSSATGMAGLPLGVATEKWAEDAHHAQRTPGAYEAWYFEGLDAAGNGVLVSLFEGLPFHPDYLTRMARSRRMNRTPFAAPPANVLPSYYPAAYMAVYEGGQLAAQFLNLYPPGSFEGDLESPELRCGPNRITLRRDGSFGLTVRGYPWQAHHGAPRQHTDQVLAASLSFAPTFAGVQHVRALRPPGPDGQAHTWVLAAPHGRLTGRVQMFAESDSMGLLDLAVDAPGYHDHVYGAGPLGAGIRRCAWGHGLGDKFALAWQWTPGGGGKTDALMLFETSGKPLVFESPEIDLQQHRTTRWLVRYPRRVIMHGADAKGNSMELLLTHRLADASPFHARLEASATMTLMGKRQYLGTGSTLVMQPQRLRWPLLSDMVLMSILPVPADDPLWRQ